ncbi:MAG TPA: YvcK family protein [Syntrophothermus lipocalidus]|nr:YvcK family protein [Syntrophothermus lipocalidus]HOV43130.1 YvcK family protein [Syntrophothermus lipocalidus]
MKENCLLSDQVREEGPHIVTVGGGTGLSVLLRGLKRYTNNLTAVVTVTDDGGSSGRLRGELGVVPPGDIRNCLVALAETETLMDRVFDHRFRGGKGLEGHNLGNLLLVAMAEITGDVISAIKEVSKVLAVRGRVLPATLEQVLLAAELSDGSFIIGETSIREVTKGVRRVYLVPENCKPLEETMEALARADAVVLGPGSLYTSIIPNIMVKGVVEALLRTNAVRIYVANIMTEKGETDGYSVADHIQAVYDHAGKAFLDYAVVNVGPIADSLLERYYSEGAMPVVFDPSRVARMGIKIIKEDLVSRGEVAWHDSDKLARVVLGIIKDRKG